MDSMEHEETQEIQSQVDSPNKSNLTPLIVRVLVIVLLIVVCIGIYFEQSSQPNQKESSLKGDLQKLGLAYHEFHRVREHSPTSLDELVDFMNNPPPPPKQTSIVPPDSVSVVVIPPSIQDMIREGQLVVVWDAHLTNSGQENDKYLLAYVKDSATNGGFALTAAGRALELTADAYKSYLLATTEVKSEDQIETSDGDSKKEENE